MVKKPGLRGSPSSTAVLAPAGIVGGASLQGMSAALNRGSEITLDDGAGAAVNDEPGKAGSGLVPPQAAGIIATTKAVRTPADMAAHDTTRACGSLDGR